MDKAEEAALAAYPDYEKENSVGVLYKVSRKAERAAYAEGYRQAMNDIAGTIKGCDIVFEGTQKVTPTNS